MSETSKYVIKIWHFNRANSDLITKAVSEFPWMTHLHRFQNPNQQVKFLTDFIINIMSNFVPNEVKKICPRDPEWLNNNVINLLRKQNKLYKKFRRNGYKNEDKISLENVNL